MNLGKEIWRRYTAMYFFPIMQGGQRYPQSMVEPIAKYWKDKFYPIEDEI